MRLRTILGVMFVFTLLLAACGDDDETGTEPTSQSADDDREGTARTIDAALSDAIVVDGDPSDWEDIAGLEMTLEAISDETADPHEATLKVAHDGDNVYVLFQVDDDYDWTADDAHLSGSAAVQWGIESGAAEHMGTEDDDRDTSLGMVDIWHWELECAAGEPSGGAVSEPGAENDPGNDGACNFDDEWATTPEDREDDNTDTGENSLLGVWTHSASEEGAAGTWTFEMNRPLDTGDSQDAQFAVGDTARLAVAYWDADHGPDGWDDDTHVQSANQGWIEVSFS